MFFSHARFLPDDQEDPFETQTYSLCKPYFLTKQIPQAKTDLKQDQESRRVITDFNPLKAEVRQTRDEN